MNHGIIVGKGDDFPAGRTPNAAVAGAAEPSDRFWAIDYPRKSLLPLQMCFGLQVRYLLQLFLSGPDLDVGER